MSKTHEESSTLPDLLCSKPDPGNGSFSGSDPTEKWGLRWLTLFQCHFVLSTTKYLLAMTVVQSDLDISLKFNNLVFGDLHSLHFLSPPFLGL